MFTRIAWQTWQTCRRATRRTAHITARGLFGCSSSKKGNNVILMGSPGAGKTTVAKIVGQKLDRHVIDIDDDHLERVWGMSVAEKLSQVGSDEFVEVEGQALLQFYAEGAVVSLSGSNPMHRIGMTHMQSLGTVVYLDVPHDDILNRLAEMKVSRIVGQNEGISMEEILQYRKQFYEGSYDVRVICERGQGVEEISAKVLDSLEVLQGSEGYASTRQLPLHGASQHKRKFLDVILEGLAPDGGLYVSTDKIPYLSLGEWERLIDCTYQERALRILEKWISPRDLHPSLLHDMINKSYSDKFAHPDITPLVKLNDQVYMLELFHGPTASFKDLALQLAPKFFDEAILRNSNEQTKGKHEKFLILVATSGDTGSAVLEGFQDSENICVLVLYPECGVSPIQRAQMTSVQGMNLRVVGVRSDFDFCQTAVKEIFNEQSFTAALGEQYDVQLSAANSINWGRLLPQVVYHASAYLDLVRKGVVSLGEEGDVCVPTGNFGNILAAYYAKEMGLPLKNLICASNENRILTDFFNSGVYNMHSRPLKHTVSPSIDILKSSNLERLLYHVMEKDGRSMATLLKALDEHKVFEISQDVLVKLGSVFKAGWTSEDKCLETIRETFRQTGYLVDTHTAVAKHVADQLVNPNRPMIIAGTAHYSKFASDILTALRQFPVSHCSVEQLKLLRQLDASPDMHTCIETVVQKPLVHDSVCDASLTAVMTQIEEFVSR